MVTVDRIDELRPKISDEFHVGPFSPRTESMRIAWDYGERIHAGQVRLSGEPYFSTHCGWVAAFIDNLLGIESWTIAALLHDAVEDTSATLDEIRDLFPGSLGQEVTHIIDGMTKMNASLEGDSADLATLQKIAMFRDPAVFLIKLADRSHNMMTLQHMKPGKRVNKASETIRTYGKLAGILNCYRWRRWLEDMAFPFAEEDVYSIVRPKIDSDPRLNLNFIRYYLNEMAHLMEAEGIDGSVRFTVNGYWQAWNKLQRMARLHRTSMQDFSAVNDIVSFRMVVNGGDEQACYRLLARVNKYFNRDLDQDRFDDYIAVPQNGYRALQATAYLPGIGAIEVAIATEDMEGENAWGVVYALKHNKDISLYRPVQILTPFGGTRFLPEGSSVLDGVASIQEFYLDKISSVKVNHAERHLYDRLNPGDLVEVVTSGDHKIPNADWLNHCNNSTARRLRSVLATVSLREAGKRGREILHPILSTEGVLDLDDLASLESSRMDKLLGILGCASVDDLYASVGGGSVSILEFKSALETALVKRASLHWTSIRMEGATVSNRPGGLAYFAGLMSLAGVNIIRTVTNTLDDGAFQLRMVVTGMDEFARESLINLLDRSEYPLTAYEIT